MSLICDTNNLKDLIEEMLEQFPQVTEIYIFGSRRYKTRSTRSDLDLLVYSDKHISPEELRDFSLYNCQYLDFFIANKGQARSCANGSIVQGTSKKDLIRKLNCLLVWDGRNRFSNEDIEWEFETVKGYKPTITTLVSGYPIAPKNEAISSKEEIPRNTKISNWDNIKSHPLAIIIPCIIIAVGATFEIINQTRIIPLEKQIQTLKDNTGINPPVDK